MLCIKGSYRRCDFGLGCAARTWTDTTVGSLSIYDVAITYSATVALLGTEENVLAVRLSLWLCSHYTEKLLALVKYEYSDVPAFVVKVISTVSNNYVHPTNSFVRRRMYQNEYWVSFLVWKLPSVFYNCSQYPTSINSKVPQEKTIWHERHRNSNRLANRSH